MTGFKPVSHRLLNICMSLSYGLINAHPIDDQVREFYRRWGFEDVPFDPSRSMIVRVVDLEKSGFVA